MNRWRATLGIVLLALVCTGVGFAVSARAPLDLLDESYLWYGVWRTAAGEVPLRDFQAYDPLRYYWGALFVRLLGDGVVAMRFSSMVLTFAMVTVGLSFLRRTVRSWWVLAGAAVVMTAWAYNAEMAAGYLVSVAAVAVGALLLERPTVRRHLLAGVFVGLAAVVGRNHGVYGVVLFGALLAFLWATGRREGFATRVGAFAGGVVLGYLPLLLMAAVPGFSGAFIESLHNLAASGFSHRSRPVPWPWRIHLAGVPPLMAFQVLTMGTLFVVLAALPLGAAAHLVVRGRRAGWGDTPQYAAVAGTLVYMHYAFARPGMTHLADGIQPLLLLLFVLPYTVRHGPWRRAAALGSGVVLAASLVLVVLGRPGFDRFLHPERYRPVTVRGDTLWMPASRAHEIDAVRRVVGTLTGPGEPVLFAPHRPGLYLVVDRPAPVKTIYFLGRQDEPDARTIREMEERGVRLALITKTAIDGRRGTALRVLHPELVRYLERNFAAQPGPAWGLPPIYTVFLRRPDPDAGGP